jgi:hypothetical protein
MNQIAVDKIKRAFHRAAAHLVAVLLRPGAIYDTENIRLWEKRGYHITPNHFYYPIPDSRELHARDFKPSELPGVDLRPESQMKLIKEAFVQFSREYNHIPYKPTDTNAFYLENDAFHGIDPFIYYCMIRHFKPKTIVEVGSGHSTLLGAQASRLGGSTRYVCIDPWPRELISKGVANIEFIRDKVEDLELNLFQELQANDILFIDSSHVIRTAGDVCFNILEVLPRLAKGVIVHIHDIFLPFDYPKEWIIEQQRYWTEQYLLQAYLAENNSAEVLFASNYLSKIYPKELRKAFPKAVWIGGASFWIRKC